MPSATARATCHPAQVVALPHTLVVLEGAVAFDLLRGRGGAAEEATRKAEVLGVNAWSFPVPPPERRPYPDAAGLATEPRHGGRAMAR